MYEPFPALVYAGGSTSVQYDITVPPWSGQEDIQLTFSTVPFTYGTADDTHTHHWRMCGVDVTMVSDDLTCLSQGQAVYGEAVEVTYAKSDDTDLAKW